MTSAVTQDQPPQPRKATVPDDDPQQASVRREEYLYRDESRLQAGSQLTSRTMARRLPSLVRRSVQMAWGVDRGATIGLLFCQIGTGVLAALGLLAVTGTITALISAGDITERLWDAAPQLAVIAAATGLRALLDITVVWLTGRLRPVLGRAAELTMIEAALGAELTANNKPGYNDAYDIADRGAHVTPDLVEEAQDVLAATATLAAGATVLTVLHPLLFLACLPQAAAYVRSARVIYLAGLETSGRRRMLGKLRWHMAYQESSEEMRACLAGPCSDRPVPAAGRLGQRRRTRGREHRCLDGAGRSRGRRDRLDRGVGSAAVAPGVGTDGPGGRGRRRLRPPDRYRLRHQLVEQLRADNHIRTAAVERAFRTVPRHAFAPEVTLEAGYADDTVPTRHAPDGRVISSISAP